jgi:hypothetical protein
LGILGGTALVAVPQVAAVELMEEEQANHE